MVITFGFFVLCYKSKSSFVGRRIQLKLYYFKLTFRTNKKRFLTYSIIIVYLLLITQ